MHHSLCIIVLCFSMGISAINAYDHLTWALEILPIVIAIPFIYRYGKDQKISSLLLFFIALHGIVLAIGGHYTYARVPLGDWLVHWGLFNRNNYDKVGHFMQGFVPAMILHEIFIRGNICLNSRGIMVTVIILSCGGISALYEIIEWHAAVILGTGAEEFLGTQGYVWDTQSDMLMALIGAMTMTTLFLHVHRTSIYRDERDGTKP